MELNATLKTFKLSTVAIVIGCGLFVRPAQAGYIVTLQQVGSNVVATGSGAIDLTGLIFAGSTGTSSGMQPNFGLIYTGPTSLTNINIYGRFTGPTSFGSGGLTSASSGSGDLVAMAGGPNELFVPQGYVSGSPLSDISTYNNATFASLGATPGVYEWTWGTGANQNFTLKIGAAAMPDSGSTFGLLFLALTVLFGASRLHSFRLA
jgi:hypothetical protein